MHSRFYQQVEMKVRGYARTIIMGEREEVSKIFTRRVSAVKLLDDIHLKHNEYDIPMCISGSYFTELFPNKLSTLKSDSLITYDLESPSSMNYIKGIDMSDSLSSFTPHDRNYMVYKNEIHDFNRKPFIHHFEKNQIMALSTRGDLIYDGYKGSLNDDSIRSQVVRNVWIRAA